MNSDTLSKELWQAANLITGFAVVQAIAFTYACAKPDFSALINTFWIKIVILVHLALIAIGECYAVWWCADKIVTLLGSQRPNENNHLVIEKILRHAAWGRIIIILVLLIPMILALYSEQLSGLPFRTIAEQ
jgi:hypothetical protein